MLTILVTVALTIFLFVSVLFAISIFLKRNDIADVAWGVGILLVGVIGYALDGVPTVTMNLLFLLVLIWGTRLAIRIGLRNLKKKEDARYQAWRASWGKWFYLRSYGQVYLLQGFLMIVVAYPLLHVSVYDEALSFSVWTMIGVSMWVVGFLFETMGDYQLDVFLKNPENKGKIMCSGLWKYTRHPNYFGEVTQWWGVWVMVIGVPFWYVALVSPLMITFLILKVSGIPMLENRFNGNPDFEEYQRKTNAFFPMVPKATVGNHGIE